MKITVLTNNEQETKNFAKKFATFLSKGDVVVLSGELGAGKTKFVEGFLAYFNMQDEISSPTFNIINEYSNNTTNIYHFDVYRLEDSDEFYAIGGEEYFENGICLIEWGETIKDVLPKEYIQITIIKDSSNENKRIIEIANIGNKYENIINKFQKEELN